MRSNFSKAAAIFFSPETLFPFLVGSIFLAVLGNAVWQIAVNIIGTSTIAAVQIALVSMLIFFISVWLFARGLNQLDPPQIPDTHIPEKHNGLILLVSQFEPCNKAIQYHLPTLKRCWLLHSAQTEAIALEVMRAFADTPDLTFIPIPVKNIYDPMEFYNLVRIIYAKLPPLWRAKDVIADYTGMTAHGSVGMVLASLNPRAPLQYIPSDPKHPNKSLSPIEIKLTRNPQGRSASPSPSASHPSN
jgi:hypothetical protein